MSKKKTRDLTNWIEAGKKNLATWKRENPAGGNLTHGIYSETTRKRYSDLRTRDGKALQAILDAIKEDIGPELDARQNLILALIREKLIIILQIAKYIETSPYLIDWQSGTVPYIIDHTFPRYSAGLMKLLDSLYGDDGIKGRKGITYEDVVESIKAEAAARAPRSDPEEEGPPLRLM
jgi:hypothetical protein